MNKQNTVILKQQLDSQTKIGRVIVGPLQNMRNVASRSTSISVSERSDKNYL